MLFHYFFILQQAKQQRGNSDDESRIRYVYTFAKVTKISLFFVRLSIILHRRERERNFFYFSTRAFNSYKLIYYGECLYIAHALRVKVANFDINYRRIGTLRKKMVRLTK